MQIRDLIGTPIYNLSINECAALLKEPSRAYVNPQFTKIAICQHLGIEVKVKGQKKFKSNKERRIEDLLTKKEPWVWEAEIVKLIQGGDVIGKKE